VDSHPEDDDWGNYIADRAAGNHLEDLNTHNLQYSILEISAAELLRDLPPTGMWYWGDSRGHPLPLKPPLQLRHEATLSQYITDRDTYREKLPIPLPRYWYDNSLRFSAKIYEMDKCYASSLASRIRIVMNKGWHGGNRLKSKKATPDDGICYLCGQDDSQAHWLHQCSNLSLSDARAAAMTEIQQYSIETIPSNMSAALLTVLRTTDEPERIWTANWSTPQIQHLEALLLGSQSLPTSQAGWSMVNDTLIQLSRILSRTALHMWSCKVILETSHRLNYRRRLFFFLNKPKLKVTKNRQAM
jgi:hypothetical protein